MACLRKTSKIGQYCLFCLLITIINISSSNAFETTAVYQPETIETKEVIGRLKNSGAPEEDIVFLNRLIEQFKLATISLNELKAQSWFRVGRGTYKIEGHIIELGNMKAEQIWNKIVNVLNLSQSYEGHPWESFFQSKGNGPAEKRAAMMSIAIFAIDEIESRTRVPAQSH